MKLNNITIKNFGTIQSINLPLANRGLVLVSGDNRDASKADSNGSGKSLLLEAICWCIWGETIRGLKGDEVVNDKIGKDCQVILTLTEDTDNYTIIRQRLFTGEKPNDLFLIKNDIDISGGYVKDTQVLINELLGLDFITFCAMMPGAELRVAEMTDKDVKLLLEKLLQTDTLSKAYKYTCELYNANEKELEKHKLEKKNLEELISYKNSQIESLKNEQAKFEDDKEEKILRIQKGIAEVLKDMGEQRKLIEKAENIDTKIEIAKSKLQDTISKDNSTKNEYRKTDELFTNLLNVLVLKQKDLERKIEDYNTIKDTCFICDQKVDHTTRQDFQKRYAVELGEVSDRYRSVFRERTDNTTAETAAREQIWKERDLHAQDVKRLEDIKDAASTASLMLSNLKQKLAILQEQSEYIQSQTSFSTKLLEEVTESLKTDITNLTGIQADIDKEEKEEKLLNFWINGFSPAGIRSFLLEHITPLLNKAATNYSEILTSNEMRVIFNTQAKQKNGKIVEKFNIEVMQENGGNSYTAASKGERSRANLLIALAIGDLATMRAQKNISFRFLDEPFENIDESGTDAVLTLLNNLCGKFETIFVVTHQDHFKQYFENKITVVKEKGNSFIL